MMGRKKKDRDRNRDRERKREGGHLSCHAQQLYVASSFNTQLVYVTLPSMCKINKLGVEGGLTV
jgi:hypothetical protein